MKQRVHRVEESTRGFNTPVAKALAAFAKGFGYGPDGRYLVGVSGGRDSMALLHALVHAGYRRLVVCHLDHQLRGRAAQADARFVERIASKWKFAVETGRADVRALARDRKLSLETAAREARKGFFFAVARKRRCRTLFLAHHADDQVETVLFNLCRGGGAVGLAGMQPAGEWQAPTPRSNSAAIRVLRPLLGVWRAEIDAYLTEDAIPFREDATNTDPQHTRNRVRHELVPKLNEVFGRDVRQSIWRAADIIGEENAVLEATLGSTLEHAAASDELACKPLSTAPVAEQRRVLRVWLKARGCHQIGYEEIERTRTLLDLADGPAKINLPGDFCVRRRARMLFTTPMRPPTHLSS